MLIPFEPGMEGMFTPYELLEGEPPVSITNQSTTNRQAAALGDFIHDNGLDAMETPPASKSKTTILPIEGLEDFIHTNGLDAMETSPASKPQTTILPLSEKELAWLRTFFS